MDSWMPPFLKQCIVTAGVAVNVGQCGLVMGYTAVLLPQLRSEESLIYIDEPVASWIAAVPGVTFLLGSLIVPIVMSRLGRKIASVYSVALVNIGWIAIVLARGPTYFIIGRALQGLSMGMSTSLGPVLIAEYSSPGERAQFLSTIGVAMSTMTLTVHVLGSYMAWDSTAAVCTGITMLDLIIVLYSPESPQWLADQRKHELCKQVYHWLRGNEEEDELRDMIEASETARGDAEEAGNDSFVRKLRHHVKYVVTTMRKREFYVPSIIVVHLYIILNWGGVHLVTAFTLDTFHRVVGDGEYDAALIVSLDVLRLAANYAALQLLRRARRRPALLAATSLTAGSLLLTALYCYLKERDLLGYDHVVFGALLVHVHTLALAAGSVPLSAVLAGELFPARHGRLAGAVCALAYCLSFVSSVKTVYVVFDALQVYGAYCLYAGVLAYCLVVVGLVLPETQGRTLQQIEETFRRKRGSPDELGAAQPLQPLGHGDRSTS